LKEFNITNEVDVILCLLKEIRLTITIRYTCRAVKYVYYRVGLFISVSAGTVSKKSPKRRKRYCRKQSGMLECRPQLGVFWLLKHLRNKIVKIITKNSKKNIFASPFGVCSTEIAIHLHLQPLDRTVQVVFQEQCVK